MLQPEFSAVRGSLAVRGSYWRGMSPDHRDHRHFQGVKANMHVSLADTIKDSVRGKD